MKKYLNIQVSKPLLTYIKTHPSPSNINSPKIASTRSRPIQTTRHNNHIRPSLLNHPLISLASNVRLPQNRVPRHSPRPIRNPSSHPVISRLPIHSCRSQQTGQRLRWLYSHNSEIKWQFPSINWRCCIRWKQGPGSLVSWRPWNYTLTCQGVPGLVRSEVFIGLLKLYWIN